MNALKIGIVEDELLIAESIMVALQNVGYRHTSPAQNYTAALDMIAHEKPDLLLIDIVLQNNPDGVELGRMVNEKFHLPFIFLTANSDQATVQRAKSVNPSAYLLKPFTENELYSSIEIAFSNYQNNLLAETIQAHTDSFVFVKSGEVYEKIYLSDIVYIESDNVYLHLHTISRNYLIRKKLDEFIDQIGRSLFIRTTRSHAVNLKHLLKVSTNEVEVGNHLVPLQKNYRDLLLEKVGTLK